MSTAECRRCSGLISFVLADNGRWRPVEAQYLAFETEEDEVVALMVEGVMTAQKASLVRVYRYHRCPEDPALRQGTPRTRVVGPEVDERTGEVFEDEDEDDDGDEVDDEDEVDQPAPVREPWNSKANCLKRHSRVSLTVTCPECFAPEGEPCVAVSGALRMTQHTARNLATAFTEDQPWPPESGQRGYAALSNWLCVNYRVLTTPATPKENS